MTSSLYKEKKSTNTPLLSLDNIWKMFSGVSVLKGINFKLYPGEIHALLGGNGSGKSTTMKIISGAYQPNAGSISISGKKALVSSPKIAHSLGVYMVPQEPYIFPHLSVYENLAMGLDIPRDRLEPKINKALSGLGFKVDLAEEAGFLSIAQQQLLEIVRGLLRDASILIFDEPTSALTFKEVKQLFSFMKNLSQQGIGIIFISHRLNEVKEISDRVSVLRDGEFVLDKETKQTSTQELVESMLAKDSLASIAKQEQKHIQQDLSEAKTILSLSHLESAVFKDINLSIKAGEVLGLAGLVGSGRTEIAEAIIGLDKHATGTVELDGKVLTKRSVRSCQQHGLVYVPEDRHAHGIFLDLPSLYTTTASILSKLGKLIIINKKEEAIGQKFVNDLNIKVNDLYQYATTLSGGNQQKVVLSKALASDPKLIILDEPTRGVDAAARQDVYRLIKDLTAQGVAVLLISSEITEIVDLSDRVIVMYRGKSVAEFRAEDINIENITRASFGANK